MFINSRPLDPYSEPAQYRPTLAPHFRMIHINIILYLILGLKSGFFVEVFLSAIFRPVLLSAQDCYRWQFGTDKYLTRAEAINNSDVNTRCVKLPTAVFFIPLNRESIYHTNRFVRNKNNVKGNTCHVFTLFWKTLFLMELH
jgi:hypothetical protein